MLKCPWSIRRPQVRRANKPGEQAQEKVASRTRPKVNHGTIPGEPVSGTYGKADNPIVPYRRGWSKREMENL